MRRRHAARGFTLVEVLVAVAVLAIAMAAVIGAMARQADNAGYLKRKTIAMWVARNRLAEIQLEAAAPGVGRADGRVEMGGVEWRWDSVARNTEDPRLRRVDIEVRGPAQAPSDGPLAQLTGFIGLPAAAP